MVKKILFVCTGNTCRSAAAEGIMKNIVRHKGLDMEVASAGIAAMPWYKIYGDLLDVLGEEGVDVSSHVPTLLSQSHIDWADLVLAMETAHKEYISSNYRIDEEKLFLLKEYAGIKDCVDIYDPIGQSKDRYRQTVREIKDMLFRVIDRLQMRSSTP